MGSRRSPTETKELVEPPLLGGPTPRPTSTSLMTVPPLPTFQESDGYLNSPPAQLNKRGLQGWGLTAQGRAGHGGRGSGGRWPGCRLWRGLHHPPAGRPPLLHE